MLLKCGQHPNVVNVREVVVGTNMDKIYLVSNCSVYFMHVSERFGLTGTIVIIYSNILPIFWGFQFYVLGNGLCGE